MRYCLISLPLLIMKTSKLLLIFSCTTLLIGLSAFNTNSTDPLHKASWLLGTWVNESSTGKTYESWRKLNPNELAGKSFMLTGNDTFVFETIKLVEQNGSIFYIPKVETQNNGKAIRFGLQSQTDKQVVFTNPQHDFPKKITYTLIHNDSLVAEISGTVKGKPRTQTIPMKRVN
jgi:hypothetical protein